MRRWSLPALGLALLGATVALAQDEKKDASKSCNPPTVKESVLALQKELQEAVRPIAEKYRAASDDDKKAILQEYYKKQGEFVPRLLELAEKNPKDPGAIDALRAAIGMSRDDKVMERVVAVVLKDHVESDALGSLLPVFSRSTAPAAEKLLRTVAEKNPKDDMKGVALLALGQHLKARSESADKEEREKLAKDAEKAFETVLEKYPGVKSGRSTVGAAAKGELNEIRHLAVGKTVPEIDGEDIDGVKFKISDYRGKVVLIDFWGHW